MKAPRKRSPARGSAGTTLAELMVATVIMSVGILGLFGSFRYITRSLYVSRAQTLATNLAQERIESLKNLSYYGLLITSAAATDARFTPNVVYDTVNYPPESIQIGGMYYTRYTYVTMADVTNGNITAVGYNNPDTGLKEIEVNVVWKDNGAVKKWTLTNLLENPAVNPLDAAIQGNVTVSGGGGALPGASVTVEQNVDWSATTNAGGSYSFKVYHGTYTVRASSAGYYDTISSSTIVARNGTATLNLALQKISTGNVAGIAWYNPNLVISQVVADTYTLANDGSLHDIEYVELFNPTTFPINIGTTNNSFPKPVSLMYADDTYPAEYYFDYGPTGWAHGFEMVNVTTYVAPGHYFLYANAPSFYINGVLVTADAYYSNVTPYAKYITNDKAGMVGLYTWTTNTWIDIVGWHDSSATNPPWYETAAIPNSGDGLGSPAGRQIVRVSSPAASAADVATYGRAYDSNNNVNDFLYDSAGFSGFVYPPKTSASGTFTVVAGKVPTSVTVSASDQNSQSVTFNATTISSGALNLAYTPFKLTGVTTGTYSVALGYSPSATYSQIVTGVSITQNQTTGIPSAATTPPWPGANLFHVSLSSTPDTGFVKGTVTDANNVPLNGITVQSGGYTKVTGTNGMYFMSVSSGTINLVANPDNTNASYVQLQYPVTVSQGAVASQNFVLSLGGRITGYCTTGTTPVPNQVVNVLTGGNQIATGTSDATGVFTIHGISTGSYTVVPVLDIGQDSSPNSIALGLASTGTVFVGTFTVSGAYGSISGTVTDNSALVTSGALVIASTAAIASSPPSIAASSAPAQTPYYMTSSKADGTYILPVRGSSTYNLSVYVPIVSNTGSISITTKTYSGVVVTVGGSVTKNVVLP